MTFPYDSEWSSGRPLGWECPKCGRCYAPTACICWYCGGGEDDQGKIWVRPWEPSDNPGPNVQFTEGENTANKGASVHISTCKPSEKYEANPLENAQPQVTHLNILGDFIKENTKP